MLILLLLACGADDQDRRIDPGEAASCGTWESVGQPVLLDACTACHGSGLAGEARHGAPAGVDLDTLQGARAWSSQIAAAVSSGDMPPGGGLSSEAAERLLTWIDCGLPGDEHALPSGAQPEGLLGAAETRVTASLDPEIEDGVVLETALSGGDLDGRVGPWSEERYVVSGQRGWLVSHTLLDEGGAEVLQETWDPPLLVYDAEQEAWTTESMVSRVSERGLVETAETWEATVEPAPETDSRLTDPDAASVTLALSGDPPEGPATTALGYRLSSSLSLVRRWRVGQDAEGAASLVDHTQLTVAWPFEDLPAFPLDEEVEWMGRLLLQEGGAP